MSLDDKHLANEVTDSDDSIQRLASAIEDINVAMLTTADPDGVLRSRPMATQQVEFDGTLWFFTKLDSGKVHSIEHDQHVNLAYADASTNRFVSAAGRAQVVQDKAKAKELWNPMLKAWFPDGLEDPQLSMIRVQVESAEIWDAPSGKFVQLVGFVKALATGKPFDQEVGRDERINLQH